MEIEDRKARIKRLIAKDKAEKEERIVKMWENLKPFNEEGGFVPELPRDLNHFHITKLLKCGAIPKEDLKDGVWYYGDNRNTKYGLWDAEKGYFKIRRYKFGTFRWDTTYHFQDDDGFALFVPIREATEEEVEAVENKE